MYDRSGKGARGYDLGGAHASGGTPGKRTRTDSLQRRARGPAPAAPTGGERDLHDTAQAGVAGAGGPIPFHDRISASFGREHDLSGVTAHVGGAAAEACDAVGASAYATGSRVAFHANPDLHTAAHEAAHVVQQRAGVQLYGGIGQAGDAYERNADAVADRVVAGQAAGDLLPPPSGSAGAGPVQRYGGGGAGAALDKRQGHTKSHPEAGVATDVHAAVGHAGAGAAHDGSVFGFAMDLGVFSGMLALKKAIVVAIWQIAPQPGNAAEVKLTASVCVDGIVAKFSFEAGIDHRQEGFALSTKTSSMVGIGKEGACGGELGFYEKNSVELLGKNPDVCIDEIGLYFDLWLREQQWTKDSFKDPAKWVTLVKAVVRGDLVELVLMVAGSKIADLLFGRKFEEMIVGEMGVGDHVQWSEEVGVQGGVKLGGGGDKGVKFEGELSGGFKNQITATKEKGGELAIEKEHGFAWDVSLAFELHGVALKLAAGGFFPAGKPAELEASLALEFDTSGKKDYLGRLIAVFEMAKAGFAGKMAATQMKGRDDVLPIYAALFGSEAHAALSFCALVTDAYNRVGVLLKYDGKDIVASVYAGIEQKVEAEVVNTSFEFHDLQEVARWPVE